MQSWRFTTIGACSPSAPCSLAQLKQAFRDAQARPTVDTVGISKGRGYPWSGAVDGLRINRIATSECGP